MVKYLKTIFLKISIKWKLHIISEKAEVYIVLHNFKKVIV